MKKISFLPFLFFLLVNFSFSNFKNPSDLGANSWSIGLSLVIPWGEKKTAKEVGVLRGVLLELVPFVSFSLKRGLGDRAAVGIEIFPVGIALLAQFRLIGGKNAVLPNFLYLRGSLSPPDVSFSGYLLLDKSLGPVHLYGGYGLGVVARGNVEEGEFRSTLGRLKSIVLGVELPEVLEKNYLVNLELDYRVISFAGFEKQKKTFPFLGGGFHYYFSGEK
jgi:hypothetical protein